MDKKQFRRFEAAAPAKLRNATEAAMNETKRAEVNSAH